MSSRHNHALQCSATLPAMPAVPAVVGMMSPVPMTVPIIAIAMVVSPVSRTIPSISVVPGSHDNGRGVDDGRWWGDEHGYGSDENRNWQPNAQGDMHPGLGRERQRKRCETQERTQTDFPQQRYRLHFSVLLCAVGPHHTVLVFIIPLLLIHGWKRGLI